MIEQTVLEQKLELEEKLRAVQEQVMQENDGILDLNLYRVCLRETGLLQEWEALHKSHPELRPAQPVKDPHSGWHRNKELLKNPLPGPVQVAKAYKGERE